MKSCSYCCSFGDPARQSANWLARWLYGHLPLDSTWLSCFDCAYFVSCPWCLCFCCSWAARVVKSFHYLYVLSLFIVNISLLFIVNHESARGIFLWKLTVALCQSVIGPDLLCVAWRGLCPLPSKCTWCLLCVEQSGESSHWSVSQ